eukprot:scaffold162027_cov29-Tisochrysis_lutea.AAC.2
MIAMKKPPPSWSWGSSLMHRSSPIQRCSSSLGGKRASNGGQPEDFFRSPLRGNRSTSDAKLSCHLPRCQIRQCVSPQRVASPGNAVEVSTTRSTSFPNVLSKAATTA